LASAISHAVVAVALGTAFQQRLRPLRPWLLGAVCAAAPDLDVLGLPLGVPYASPFGHRGASHSLLFAALLATAVLPLATSRGAPGAARRTWCFLFLAAASHGLLDALTNGGLGVAFFWPFSNARFFLPFRPLEVSPIGVRAFLGARGVEVLANELLWLWIPAGLLATFFLLRRRRWS
jgi:inner membrane protein